MKRSGVAPGLTMEFSSVEAIKRCVKNGLGNTLLPLIAVEEDVLRGDLVNLRWNGPDFDMNTQVIIHRDKWASPAIKELISLARGTMRLDEA